MRVLVLDPDEAWRQALERELEGVRLQGACGQTEGLQLFGAGGWDLILLAEEFSGAGLELLPRIVAGAGTAAAPVVLLTADPSMETTLTAIRRGAHDVLHKPIDVERIREILALAAGARRARPLPPSAAPDAMVGTSAGMMAIYKALARAAASDATVLLLGESGTGKEMVARKLHAQSRRAPRPFVAINCAAIPENLLESELFGHEKGAFTGAIGRRIGRFERANGGTLFLDEIGDMSLALQAKILRALNEREVERVGGSTPVKLDVRIVAATNQALTEAVEEGRFREDLYYRLAVVTLSLPPLRERGDDLDRLVEHFTALYAERHSRSVTAIALSTFDRLRAHVWPGNVRQLRNAIERAVVMCDRPVLLPVHLPPEVLNAAPSPSPSPSRAEGAAQQLPQGTLAEVEQIMIRRAIASTGGNLTRAAELLGIHRNTLRRKISDHGIDAR